MLYHAYEYTTHRSIDLSGYDKESLDNNPYPNGPCIDCYKVPMIFNCQIYKEKIFEYLKQEFYVCLNINTIKINAYYGCDLIHPILISGFYDESNVFYVSDFFPPSSSYRCLKIDIREVINAISLDYPFILLYKKIDIDVNLYEEINLLKNILYETLLKIQSGNYMPYNPYYFKNKILKSYTSGIKVYDLLISDLQYYTKKSIHIMLDCKLLTLECLKPLEKERILTMKQIKEYEVIIEELVILRSMFIKYELTNNEELLYKMKKKLALIKSLEFSANEEIIATLNSSI